MDLNTITDVVRPQSRGELHWSDGDAWLGGGTWLFSEPQTHLRRLIDLAALRWPAIEPTDATLRIAATCTIAQLDALACPPEWLAAALINPSCRAFLASFKIWKTATVGGNLCLALPAGPMIALMSALDGVCVLWAADGSERRMRAVDFVIGNGRTALAPGELLRAIDIPISALRRRAVSRQISLTPVGRSAALLIGTHDDAGFTLTITASTIHPVQLSFTAIPSTQDVHDAIGTQIADDRIHNDLHGASAWRKAMTLRLAEQIRAEMQATVRA